MKAKLTRTLLSMKPENGSALTSLLSLFVLSVIFVLYQENDFGFADHLTANAVLVFGHHQYWRLFTAPLLHADLEHLTSNALFFAGLAYLLNGYFGFWIFPLTSFLIGGLINLIVLQVYSPEVFVLGASGIVYFMATFWLTLYFGIERGISKIRRLMNTTAFVTVLLIPEAFQERVSYLSHAVGFGLGIIVGILYFFARRKKIRSYEIWELPEPELSPIETDETISTKRCGAHEFERSVYSVISQVHEHDFRARD
jgi:rhomboid protease GluP